MRSREAGWSASTPLLRDWDGDHPWWCSASPVLVARRVHQTLLKHLSTALWEESVQACWKCLIRHPPWAQTTGKANQHGKIIDDGFLQEQALSVNKKDSTRPDGIPICGKLHSGECRYEKEDKDKDSSFKGTKQFKSEFLKLLKQTFLRLYDYSTDTSWKQNTSKEERDCMWWEQ